MVNEPVDMIMPMLPEIRGEVRDMRGDMAGMKQQLDKLESG